MKTSLLALLALGISLSAATACSSAPSGTPGTGGVEANPANAPVRMAPQKPERGAFDNDPNDWAFVYTRYFAEGTVGHCGNSGCHSDDRGGFKCGSSEGECYDGLVASGLVNLANPSASRLGNPQRTPLAWYATEADGSPAVGRVDGRMPGDAAFANREAASAVTLWLSGGARNGARAAATSASDAGAPGTLESDGGAVNEMADASVGGQDASVADGGAGDAGGAVDSGVADASLPDAGAASATWTALYTNYFGPNTPGHCGNSGCHANARAGFKCGADKDTCYNGLLAAELIDPRAPATSLLGDPNGSPLSWFGGRMPKDDAVANAAAQAAVTAWLNAGALNN